LPALVRRFAEASGPPAARRGMNAQSVQPTVAGGALPTAPSMSGGATVPVKQPIFQQLRENPRVPLMVSAAIAAALLIVLFMWTRAPDYRVLYSNLSDRDGGAIITSLQAMNIPYKFADGGGAIMVPADAVNEARLRLAQQGLPKGGSVGFELMDSQKFGISQFAEQVNYQRALEGELERTIESISSVQSARVHLAIPKPSVFVREQEKPSASVLLDLYPGRSLDDGQVSAITHMVASGVPELLFKDVTVVDQNGNLLTSPNTGAGLDASQLKYIQQIEQNTKQRIEAILAPLYGAGNAHAQVSADVDFSQTEQTAETYQPNQKPAESAIRSQQSSESSDSTAGAANGGVPGALSNQPPATASAPLTNAAAAQAAQGADGASGASAVAALPTSTRKDTTTNYELDKTIRHIEEPMGGIKRLSAAVVVNYHRQVDAHGKSTMQPLSTQQLAQTDALVKDAMGFDAKRGDTVNVVNSAFSVGDAANGVPDLPLWKQPDMIDLAKTIGKYVAVGIVGLYLFFGVLRPSLRKLLRPAPPAEPQMPMFPTEEKLTPLPEPAPVATAVYDKNLQYARSIARQDPKVVATVVKNWVADER
jgi:flagellar M-ring protein FliF